MAVITVTAFVLSAMVVLNDGYSTVKTSVANAAAPAGTASPASLKNTASDPTLPSGFPPANFSDPQAAPPPAVPDTTPVIVPIESFGTVPIPNGVWETVILNITGYDAGTAYDYFNSFSINGAHVWLGVNPEVGRWAVDVNISQFMSFFDAKNSISVSGSTLGLHQNFRGIQYNNYTLEFYPVPIGRGPPVYPSVVVPLKKGTTYANIPSDTRAAFIQSIVIDSEFQYTLNPSWEAYTWTVNGHKLAESFIYPWINSGGIDLFSWRPVYPPYMLDHQWNNVNLTDALGMIEGNNISIQPAPATGSPGIGLFMGNLFLYTSTNVLSAKQIRYNYDAGPLVTVSQTLPGLYNENGNSYSLYDSYRNITFSGSSTLITKDGIITISSHTEENYTNLQSLPNSVWQNMTQNETTLTHTVVVYHEANRHGVVSTLESTVFPVTFDYGAVLTYLNSSNGLSFYNYTSYFLNVMEAYNTSTDTVSNINGQTARHYMAADDMIYGTNGEFSSILEFGPGFAVILNVTMTYHLTKKMYTYSTMNEVNGIVTMTVWTHKMAALGTDPNLYYVQETMYLNTITTYTLQFNSMHMT